MVKPPPPLSPPVRCACVKPKQPQYRLSNDDNDNNRSSNEQNRFNEYSNGIIPDVQPVRYIYIPLVTVQIKGLEFILKTNASSGTESMTSPIASSTGCISLAILFEWFLFLRSDNGVLRKRLWWSDRLQRVNYNSNNV